LSSQTKSKLNLTVFSEERATGGNVMGHASTYRILLKKAGRDRIAIMVDSPYHAYDQTKFSISEKGVHDVVERNSGPEW
jgi:DNA repair protein RadA